MNPTKVLIIAISLSLLPAKLVAAQEIPADLIPMYGGMDRASDQAIKTGDEEFIAQVTEAFGTRQNAAEIFVDTGFRHYYESNLSAAMRRFNQAWLIDPENPEVYWGFASIQYDIGANCSAMKMTEHALMLGYMNPEFLADAGMMHGLCPLGVDGFSNKQRDTYFDKSEALFEKAVSLASTNPYIYDKWGQTLYWRGDYEGAWDRVFLVRETGGEPHPQFLEALKEKMPEPES
jgi:tetratricopeptide (TPR) repeat protein